MVVGDALADGGDPDGYRAMLKSQVQKLGLSQAVQFTGFRDDMPELMNTIDIFVHASLVEPFGSVIVEAMAAGRPVIASRTLGPQEIIRDGESGLLTTPGDSSELASAMLRLLADPELAQRIGKSGREYATKHYDLNDTIRLMDRHFQEVIEDRVPLCSIREASKS